MIVRALFLAFPTEETPRTHPLPATTRQKSRENHTDRMMLRRARKAKLATGDDG
jgi:hypothetical protein